MQAARMMRLGWLGAWVLATCSSNERARPAEASETAAPAPRTGVVVLTPEQEKSARIALGKAERRLETAALSATAQIEPSADGVARVGSRLGGRIAALKAGVGDPVTKGSVVAVVDSPELGRAKADYLAALAVAKVTRETADRERALYNEKISSERDWRQAEAEATKARA